MILVDSSVWIDHIQKKNAVLSGLLERDNLLLHPFILGEIALGSLANRENVIGQLSKLRQIPVARHEEVMEFIAAEKLFALGIGYIDVHLLASVRITPGTLLWTRDKRLRDAALRLGLSFIPT